MAKRKWSKGIQLKKGSLSALGYPSLAKLKKAVLSGRVPYKTLMSKLNFIANMGNTTAKRVRAGLKAWNARRKKQK